METCSLANERLIHVIGWHSWIPHTSHSLVYYWLSLRYSVRCPLLNLTLTSHCKLLYINLIDGTCEVWGIVLKKFLKRRGWHRVWLENDYGLIRATAEEDAGLHRDCRLIQNNRYWLTRVCLQILIRIGDFGIIQIFKFGDFGIFTLI